MKDFYPPSPISPPPPQGMPPSFAFPQTGIPMIPPGMLPEDGGDLRTLLLVLRRRAAVVAGVALAVLAVSTRSALKEVPVYQGNFQVLVEPVNAADDFSDVGALLGEGAGRSGGLDYATQIQVLRSPEILEPIAAALQASYPDLNYAALLENLTITRPGDTKILEVRYSDNDPVQIERVLDALSQAYLAYSLDERQTNLRQGLQFIDQQLPELQGQVDFIQERLESFRQVHGLVDLELEAGELSSQTSALNDRKLALQNEASEAIAFYQAFAGDEGALMALDEAPIYQQLLAELRRIETEIAQEQTRFEAEGRTIQALRKKRDSLIPLIQQEAQRVVATKRSLARSRMDLVEDKISSTLALEQRLSQQQQQLPTLIRQYTDLQRELGIATDALTRFRIARENLGIEAAQTEIPWQLIQAPVRPTSPISPNLRRSLMLGAVASLLLGLGAALLLEKLDNVYHSVDDLKGGTKLPLLGTLPFNRNLQGNAAAQNWQALGRLFSSSPRWLTRLGGRQTVATAYGYSGNSESTFLEALRILHTNVRMLVGAERPVRSIIISSALPGDGKSTVAANLAQVATAMGQRVLLVDVDLRKPQVHDRLNIPNKLGLSNMIASGAPLDTTIQQVIPSGKLYALTAGQIPPDPTKLLASQAMKDLMVVFEERFDLVIYDAPPSTGLADVSLIGQATDGLVLVSRMGKTDRSVLKQTIETLKMAKIPILGIVANGVKSSGFSGYRYYAYGYGRVARDEAMAREQKMAQRRGHPQTHREEGSSHD